MARGYYTRTVIAAWDFRNGALTRRWTFDSQQPPAARLRPGRATTSCPSPTSTPTAATRSSTARWPINDNGSRLWNTGHGHGDALHVGDLIPSRAGLEVFKVDRGRQPARRLDGRRPHRPVIWQHAVVRLRQRPRRRRRHLRRQRRRRVLVVRGRRPAQHQPAPNVGRKPGSTNFLVWWDGDPVRELLDGTHIDKYGTGGDTRLLTARGVHSNNGTKSTPSLSGDLLGDWREEVIWPHHRQHRAAHLHAPRRRPTARIYTLMHDPQYRVAIAWQNTAYNQPPHPSFFIGNGMATPPQPNIYVR